MRRSNEVLLHVVLSAVATRPREDLHPAPTGRQVAGRGDIAGLVTADYVTDDT